VLEWIVIRLQWRQRQRRRRGCFVMGD
jgi:hypothetical protein